MRGWNILVICNILEEAHGYGGLVGGTPEMTGDQNLVGQRILVVEDDYYLASDAARVLQDAGAEVVGPFASEAAAMAQLDDLPPDFALVDINLGAGPSFELAQELKDRHIPFLFTTGYDQNVIPAEFSDVERLEKPIDLGRVIAAVSRLLAAGYLSAG